MRHSRAIFSILLSIPLLAVNNCDGGTTPPSGHEQCTINYSQTALDWQMEHIAPATCPVDASEVSSLEAGATIFETSTTWPSDGDYSSLETTIYNNYYYSGSWSGSGSLANGFDFFSYGPPYSGSSNSFDWQAQESLEYDINSNPDYAEFEIYCPFCSSPAANYYKIVMEISYENEPE